MAARVPFAQVCSTRYANCSATKEWLTSHWVAWCPIRVLPINIRELIGREITDDEIREMTRKYSHDYTATCGCLKVLKAEDMEAIYKNARG